MCRSGRNSILVTRPEPGASRTAAALLAMGYTPVVAPLLRIIPFDVDLPAPGDVQATLVTSSHALACLPAEFHPHPLLAVGDGTALRAERLGFAAVSSADGDGEDLAALTLARCSPDGPPLLLATGQGHGESLAAALRDAGFGIVQAEVYGTEKAAAMPHDAFAAIENNALRAALFFSTETAALFVGRLPPQFHAAIRHVDAVAISDRATAPLRLLPWRRIRVALRPTQEAVLGAI